MIPRLVSRSAVPVALAAAAALLLSGCAFLGGMAPVGPILGPAIASCGVLTVAPDASGAVDPETLDATVAVVRERLMTMGLTEATAQAVPPDRVAVALPQGDDTRWRQALERSGRLEFVPIPPELNAEVIDGAPLPAGVPDAPIFDGSGIVTASLSEDQVGHPAVSVVLDAETAVRFDDWAADNLGNRFAIVLDGIVLSAPVIQTTHFGGQAQITGDFTDLEAQNLLVALSSGPLPTGVTETSWTAAEDGTCPLP